jgi:autotransporter adhesin
MKKILLLSVVSFSLLKIYAQKHVGIGTTTPLAALHVADSSVLFSGPATLPANASLPPVSGPGNRMMWYADKAAFRAGGTSGLIWDKNYVGKYSFAVGLDTQASGDSSTALGSYTIASAGQSTALGAFTTASGLASTSMGYFSVASGDYSFANGDHAAASGIHSTAIGHQVTASGLESTAMGVLTLAEGDYSTCMGKLSQANQLSSIAIGNTCYATQPYCIAMGNTSTASGGQSSIAIGDHATSSGGGSMAFGSHTTASGSGAIAMGINTTASGGNSIAIGEHTTASGTSSMAIGSYVSTSGYGGSLIIGDASSLTNTNCFRYNEFRARFDGGYALYTNNATTTGVFMLSGANAWSSISDSTKKEKFRQTDGEYVLSSISKMRLGSWNYKFQNAKIFRHYGPMAQEFYKAFGNDGVGKIGCDTLINSADIDGVMMIGLQALEKRSSLLAKENEEAITTIDALRKDKLLLQEQVLQLRDSILQLKIALATDNTKLAVQLASLETKLNGLLQLKQTTEK